MDKIDLEYENDPKQRHGFVTFWLVLLIVSNSFTVLAHLFIGDLVISVVPQITENNLILLGVLAFCNLIFSVMLLRWLKIGFWGFVLGTFVNMYLSMDMGISFSQSVLGLLSGVFLYAILQIKKDGISAWDNLE